MMAMFRICSIYLALALGVFALAPLAVVSGETDRKIGLREKSVVKKRARTMRGLGAIVNGWPQGFERGAKSSRYRVGCASDKAVIFPSPPSFE
jgi:hypothetical protein